MTTGTSNIWSAAPTTFSSGSSSSHTDDRIIEFANILRRSGMHIGTDAVIAATRAVSKLSAGDSIAFFWVLHALFVSRHSEQNLFVQAFGLYWLYSGAITDIIGTAESAPNLKDRQPMLRRLREAMAPEADRRTQEPEEEPNIEMEGTFSDVEMIRHMDFAMMSEKELSVSRQMIKTMKMPFEEIKSRRRRRAENGAKIDMRRTLRTAIPHGGEIVSPKFSKPSQRRVPLIVLCDISGSMESYTRTFIHFLYFLANDRDRVHIFLFGTRLSNITRKLKDRDPDKAIARVSEDIDDWSGGTKIGPSVKEFNANWSRRLLGQNATVLMLTDGLERGEEVDLGKQIHRLRSRARRLVWLNPLMRYAGYAPLASGAKTLSEHADIMLPCHNLASLEELYNRINNPRMWRSTNA